LCTSHQSPPCDVPNCDAAHPKDWGLEITPLVQKQQKGLKGQSLLLIRDPGEERFRLIESDCPCISRDGPHLPLA